MEKIEDGKLLYEAIARRDLVLLRQSKSALLFQTPHQRNTTLHLAVQFERRECVEAILKRLLLSRSWLILDVNIDGDTALHIAARQGQVEIVELLLDHGEKLGYQDIENRGNETVLRQLLSMTNNQNNTALHVALLCDDCEVVKLLTEADPCVEYFANSAGKTPLYLAAEEGFPDAVRQIVRTCPPCAYGGPDGKTAMHAAVIRWDPVIIRELARMKPATIKEADDHGWTPLHYAAYIRNNHGHEHVISEIDKSVTYIQDKNGMTPLHVAAGKGKSNLVTAIMVQCPDCVEVLDHKGRNFLHIAALRGKEGVVRCALEQFFANKGSINRTDNDGNTPLHLACISKAYDVVVLLGKDARVNSRVRNMDNLTALDILNKDSCDVNMDKNEARLSAKSVLQIAARSILRSANTNLIQVENINREGLGEPLTAKIPKKNNDQVPAKGDGKKMLELVQRISDSHLVVAALIATVTFAAGFALPGGYKSDGQDEGMPTLLRKMAFRAFVISNTIAMLLSSLAVLIHFMMKLYINHEESDRIDSLITRAFLSTLGAILAMMLAFVTGTYATLANSHALAVKTCVIGSSFYLMAFFLLRREFMSMFLKFCEKTWSFIILVIKAMCCGGLSQLRAFFCWSCFEFFEKPQKGER